MPSFQSTLPSRGAIPSSGYPIRPHRFQSTLPSRGAMPSGAGWSAIGRNFNPRSPHGERCKRNMAAHRSPDFNPRSPHGERSNRKLPERRPCDFNPRSPHGERLDDDADKIIKVQFQSTLPSRGAILAFWIIDHLDKISIHAPLTGSDYSTARIGLNLTISIHAPLTGSDLSGKIY